MLASSRAAMAFSTPVADACPIEIVDGFEIIDIDEQHRGAAARRAAGFQRRPKPGEDRDRPAIPVSRSDESWTALSPGGVTISCSAAMTPMTVPSRPAAGEC